MNLKTVEAMVLYELLRGLLPTPAYSSMPDPWKEQQLRMAVQLLDDMFVKHKAELADADNK